MRKATINGEFYESQLAVNLRLLIKKKHGGSRNAFAQADPPMPQGTINKICNGTRDATTDTLWRLQEKTGYAMWQLIHPDFDPEKMAPAMDAKAMRLASIYSGITDPAMREKLEAIAEQFEESPDPDAGASKFQPGQASKTRA